MATTAGQERISDRERELLEKWTRVLKRATPEEQERLLMAADMLNLLGKYVYDEKKPSEANMVI